MFEHSCPAVSRAAVVGEGQRRHDPVSPRRKGDGNPVGYGPRVGDHLGTGCISRKDDFLMPVISQGGSPAGLRRRRSHKGPDFSTSGRVAQQACRPLSRKPSPYLQEPCQNITICYYSIIVFKGLPSRPAGWHPAIGSWHPCWHPGWRLPASFSLFLLRLDRGSPPPYTRCQKRASNARGTAGRKARRGKP